MISVVPNPFSLASACTNEARILCFTRRYPLFNRISYARNFSLWKGVFERGAADP